MRLPLLFLSFSFAVCGQMVDAARQVKNKPYSDIRRFGAVCNGTNQNTAVQAAIAFGEKVIYIPAGCLWNPPLNAIPAGLTLLGENWQTSKIWPAVPESEFLGLGALSVLENINTNGVGCTHKTTGCPVKMYMNNNQSEVPVQNYSNTSVFNDVGSTTEATNPADTNDTNGVVVIQRGQGGGIYGQYNGGVGAESGSGIHAQQSSNSSLSAGLRVTRTNTGAGTILDEGAGAETGDVLQYTSAVKTGGNIFTFFQSTSTFTGNMINANLGFSGSFTGRFESYTANGTQQHWLDALGNYYHAGYESPRVGGDVASAGAITPSGPIFHVTGTDAISTINIPPGLGSSSFCLRLIADAAYTATTGGNIAASYTAEAGKMVQLCYDPTTTKFYPNQ